MSIVINQVDQEVVSGALVQNIAWWVITELAVNSRQFLPERWNLSQCRWDVP
jgi:hypothetical protein